MGWKGNLRSGMAIVRSIERAERRKANNAARQYKAMQKQEAFENAQRAIEEYNNYISLISSTHKETNEKIDWHQILSENEPSKPTLKNDKQNTAEQNLKNYKPSFFDKYLGGKPKKIKALEEAIEKSKAYDLAQYHSDIKEYEKELASWKLNQEFAKGILSEDTNTYKRVIEYLDPFSDITELGSGLSLNFSTDYVEISLLANEISVIPDFILQQTSTGKLSKKKMPVGKFYELYQDYICGCALRVARETISLLPVSYVLISVLSEMVNPATGHLEKQCILSVAMPRATLDKLNFDTLDPSDSMKNFVHKMKFSKTSGFSVVPILLPADINL